jgi:dienelactone hydrolase
VALYPGCARPPDRRRAAGSEPYRPVAPLLILIGERDDWTPAEPCRKLAAAAQEAGHPVAIKVYPGAHHAFDSPHPVRYVATRVNASAPSGRGATTGGDPWAWADSIREVLAFFDRHLKSHTITGDRRAVTPSPRRPRAAWARQCPPLCPPPPDGGAGRGSAGG